MSVTTMARQRIASALAGSVYDNPVLIKDFRTRMRGWKAFVVMGAYVALMAVVLLIAYYVTAEIFSRPGFARMTMGQVMIGQVLFGSLTWAQTFLLTLIIPALSSGALTHELEKRTIEMLALSPLSAGKIVVGKQLSVFLYVLVLLVCSLPLSGICLMLGGISPAEIAVTYLLLGAWAFVLTCSGVLWSSISKKTTAASGNNFGMCLMYFIVTLSAPSALMVMSYATHRGYSANPFMLLNPIYASSGALQNTLVCGITVPLALVAFVLHMAVGSMFLLIATTHVRHKAAERALPIRLLLIGITVFVVWLAAGSATYSPSRSSILGTGITLLFLAVIGSAVFATGAIRKPIKQAMIGYAFSWRRVFKSDIGGAIGFVTLWTALAYATYGAAVHFQARVPAAPPLAARHGFWTCYLHVGVSILVLAAAMTAVGVLASSITRRRGNAAGLLVLFAVIAFAGYGIIGAYLQDVSHPSGVVVQLAAFWPLTPILSSTGEFTRGEPAAPHWINNAWIVTSVVYFVIGFGALLLAGPAYAKTRAIVED